MLVVKGRPAKIKRNSHKQNTILNDSAMVPCLAILQTAIGEPRLPILTRRRPPGPTLPILDS